MSNLDDLIDLLACPVCEDRPALKRENDHLVCTLCARRYPIVDGIPHLLPESAEEAATA
ncbi:MAG: Trm112 family protein [Methanoregulaceae archaeon]|jgi:uncharacterized protein YbaR (Trm112 family)|nr:Trm112 family protein [Methanoregulaceae archaeon]